jgi:large subunit ribosomal protein L10
MGKTVTTSHQATPYQGRARKETLVSGMTDKVGRAKGLVFTNYQGLTHQQLEGLKKAVKKIDAEYVITKNRLVLRALDGVSLDEDSKEKLQQPTATLFMYSDVVEPLKHITKSLKEVELPTIKFGVIEGKVITDQDVLKLATLPALPVLRAQLLGQMNAPIQGLHRALQWNLQSLVMTLNAIAQQKA